MGCHFVARPFGQCLFIASVFVTPLAQGDNTEVIFAAENALYGAGYDIGKADGWMDSPLRSAIRQYQYDTRGLEVSGELDSATLWALGTRERPDTPVSGNSLASRQAALAKLELPAPAPEATRSDPPRHSLSATASPAIEVAEPTQAPSEPEPEVEPVQVAAITLPPEIERPQVDTRQPDKTPEPSTPAPPPASEPKAHADASDEPSAPVATTRVSPAQSDSKEPMEPLPVEPEVATAEPDSSGSDLKAGTTIAVAPETVPEQSPAPVEASPEMSEPVASSPSPEPPVPVQTVTPRSSGGFFSALFDFLFGWLV